MNVSEICKHVALDWAWGMIIASITTATGGTIGSAVLLGAKGVRVFSNFLFNVDKDVESFYQIKAGVVCEDAMKRVIGKLNSQGNISNNLENSIIYNSAVDAFQKTILLGFDYSIGLLQSSAETPTVKYTSQYDEYMNLIEQIRTFKKNKQKIYSTFENKCLDSYKKVYCLDFDKIFALLGTAGIITNADDRTHQVEEFDFDYSITNGKVTIQRFTAYDGKYRHISIPSKIEGYPVTKIATNAFKYSTIESVIIPITVLEIEEYVFEGCNKLRKIVLINDNIKLDGSSFNNTIKTPEIIIYCNNNSSGKDFCEKNEGFDYQPLNYDGINLWKVAPLDGEYHIHIGSELAYLSRVVDGGTDLNDYIIILENDIDMDSNPIMPIGTSEKCPYKGSFDGNNYTINNLNITTTNNLNALFGYVISRNSQFKNVDIDGKLNERDSYGAGLIARTNVTDGKLSISNISINLNDSGIYGYHKGGIVGEISSNGNSNVVLKKCINKGHIESFSAYGDNVTGGLVGSYNATASDNLSFIQCANTGFVKSDSRYQSAGVTCGGLLGQVVSGNIIFSQCLVDGNIQAKAGWITLGGFIGFASPNSLKISNCEMFANIKPIGIGSGLRIVGALIADLSYENTNSDSKFVTMPWYDVINYATEIDVSDGITTIGKYAFYKAENVQKISLPDTLTTINERAFEYCSSVEELIIPDTVNQIGYGTFANMTNLKKVTVPASTTYCSYCFDKDKAINEIHITYGIDGVMPVANVTAEQMFLFTTKTGAFGPWKYVENAVVTIEDGVSKIGDKAFYYCSGIKCIEFPDTVQEIGTGNFVSIDAATEITILNPNCTIQEGSFTSSNTIRGYSNSTAEVFANNNSIPFKAIDEHIHTYGEWTYNGDAEYISSSNYKNGTQTRTCSVCGAEETVEAPNTALLRRRGNALALESSITLTTYITKDIVDYYDEVYAEFTRNGKTETVYASDKTFKSGSTVYNIFDYAGISPQAMGDDIEIKFYGIKDGVKYWGETYTYSVTTYVTSTLSKSTTSAKLKTMLVDLMYYGEACQIYQNYKTDSLMTNILTDEQKNFRSTDELNLTNIKDSSYATCENRLVRFGTALRLNNAVEIAIPLNMTNVTLEELTFKVKIGSRDLTYTYSDNPENFEKGKDGYWYFYFDGVYANQMSDEVFITAYRGDEQVSYTLKYSVESYAATVTDSKLKKVTDAMMRYGNSSKFYSGK